MSHQPTTTDFDKYGGTFKVTASNTIKRSSNESHDDESKKMRLEKSGSSNILATSANVPQQASGGVIAIGSGPDSTTKKLKTRKIISGDNSVTAQHQQYQLIVEDSASAGAFSEESCGGAENSAKLYSTSGGGGEEMLLIRKQTPVSNKLSENNDVGVEERVVHIEGDPGGTASSSYITGISGKQTPKRLQIGIAEAAKKSFGDGIDLKLITTNCDLSASGKIQMLSGTDKKPEQLLLAVSSTSNSPQNTFTYSRVCSVSNVGGPTGESMNIKSLQGATIKNQSLVVSSKKLLPEAKVSIGNTTISVPLLKPLSSPQSSSESSKSVIHTIQTSAGQSPQAQLSKFLNIKRGQKGSQTTYVSLSQLQIKPVSSAKIVQAKVVSKKIPLQFQTVQQNKPTLLQQSSGVVTITSNKTDLQQIPQQSTSVLQSQSSSPHKKQQHALVKEMTPGSILKSSPSNSNSEEVLPTQSSTLSATGNTTEQPTLVTEKTQVMKSSAAGSDNCGPSFVSADFLPVGVKVVHTSSGLRSSTTGGHVDTVDQLQTQSSQTTQRINIGPTISIVRQNSPQLVTTSGNLSTMSLSMADAASGQQKLILTKSQFANVNSSSINSTSTTGGGNTVSTSIPRNISFMLTKTSSGQQVFTNAGSKTTLCVTTSANNPSKSNATTRMNLNINPSLTASVSSSSTPTISVNSSAVPKSDADAVGHGDAVTSAQECTNTQHTTQVQATQLHTNVVQNRKIIQVLPGGLYSSSGGSFVQISKTKTDHEDDKKKTVEMEHHQTTTNQHSVQHQLLSAQQQQQQQQSSQQQHQIHLQIQQQHQTQQQVQIQQIQTQQIAQSQQHLQQRQQLLPRHQLLHKHQMQQQIQKQQQQQIQHQQQQQIQHQTQQQNPTQDPPNEPSATQTSYALSTSEQQHPPTPSTSSTSSEQQSHKISASQHEQKSHIISAPQAPKSEESNNVLLKQLLQNTNSTPINCQNNSQHARSNSAATPTTVLPGRKVINVRAPSLGLVSSLEAQLARPVIPPVPASESSTHSTVVSSPMTTTSTAQSPIQKSVNDHTKVSSTHVVLSSVSTISQSSSSSTNSAPNPSLIISTSKTLSQTPPEKSKFTSSPLISKETSFVSKPTLPESSNEQSIEIFSLQSTGESTGKGSGEPAQRHQQSFDQTTFKTSHSAPQSSTTTKITKYMPDIKKIGDMQQQQHHHQQQQQQQSVSVSRTFTSGPDNKEK